jgi:hypothetical protein
MLVPLNKGAIEKKSSRKQKPETDANKLKAGCWVVGLGDYLRGRRESVQKGRFSKPFHPTRLSQFLLFPLLPTRP